MTCCVPLSLPLPPSLRLSPSPFHHRHDDDIGNPEANYQGPPPAFRPQPGPGPFARNEARNELSFGLRELRYKAAAAARK